MNDTDMSGTAEEEEAAERNQGGGGQHHTTKAFAIEKPI